MKRILFVDDDPRLLDGLRRTLRHLRGDWDMRFASSGAQALQLMEVEPVDVLVTDMRMPEMDGATLLGFVRKRHPETARIVLSGHTETHAMLRVIPLAHQFLTKPCPPDTLREVVQRSCSVHDFLAEATLRKIVGGLESLPALPRVCSELQRMVDEPSISLREIADLVEQDVAITARVLQIVNSSFFGLGRKLTGIEEAIAYLGTEVLLHLVTTTGVFAQFEMQNVETLTVDRVQSHSLRVARVAMRIAPERTMRNEAFLAGLLHDLGHLVIASCMPDKLRTIEQRLGDDPALERATIEREVVGASHAQLGGYLLGLWGLPHPIVEAVVYHHEPLAVARKRISLVDVVYIAEALVDELEPLPPSGRAPLHPEYLQLMGVASKVDEWRQIAAEA